MAGSHSFTFIIDQDYNRAGGPGRKKGGVHSHWRRTSMQLMHQVILMVMVYGVDHDDGDDDEDNDKRDALTQDKNWGGAGDGSNFRQLQGWTDSVQIETPVTEVDWNYFENSVQACKLPIHVKNLVFDGEKLFDCFLIMIVKKVVLGRGYAEYVCLVISWILCSFITWVAWFTLSCLDDFAAIFSTVVTLWWCLADTKWPAGPGVEHG